MATGMLAPKNRLGARPVTASNRSASTIPRRILPSAALRKPDGVGHHHAHPALGVGRRQHVQQGGRSPQGLGRDGPVAVEAVGWVVGGELVAPVLQTEGRIGDHPVVGQQASLRVQQSRFGDDVAMLQPRRPQALEQQVELADGQGAQVALLAVQHQVADVAALLLDVPGGVDQHPAGPCGWVANAHPFLRLQQLHDEAATSRGV